MLGLAELAGLHELVGGLVSVACPNPVAKTTSIIAGMLAGADCIDDLDPLRHGAMGRLFDGVRAPSTLGTYLRSFTHGHVQQLDSVGSRFLVGLASRVPGLLAGGDQLGSSMLMIPSARSTATPSEVPRSATPGCVGSTPNSRPSRPAGGAGDRGGPASPGQYRLGHRCGTATDPGDQHRPRSRGDRTGPRPGRLGLLRPRVRGRRAAGQGVVLRHRPDEPAGHRGDQPHPRRCLDSDRLPERGLGASRGPLGLRGRGRRDHDHRVHLAAPTRPGDVPAGGAPGPTVELGRPHRIQQRPGAAVRRQPAPRVHHQLHAVDHRGRPASP